MNEFADLEALASAMGVHVRYRDGLGREVKPPPETLVQVCRALGAELAGPRDARDALATFHRDRRSRTLPPVRVAWDGTFPTLSLVRDPEPATPRLILEDGEEVELEVDSGRISTAATLPPGYHRLTAVFEDREETCTVISAPLHAWRPPGSGPGWGVATQLPALRSSRSRSLADLTDFERLCGWVAERGGELVTALPLLPTFNDAPVEPSPYSPVSRLFWSELVLDLRPDHRPVPPPERLDVARADAEVRRALAERPLPDPETVDSELARYARFRGAQKRLGRSWREWPGPARDGRLTPDLVDPDEEAFHLKAQTLVREQLGALGERLTAMGVRLGLDLAVGAHPEGYDTWSRGPLFAAGMSVGAPPDAGFPSGQDWGFAPVSPAMSRLEGHRYLAASVAHQAGPAGVLRVDHVMALSRLYWIPHGVDLDRGTYVSYPVEELFAVLCLESHRQRCELVGENLGTVPSEIEEALPRHRIRGMYLALFEAALEEPGPPAPDQVAMIGTHDTPTLSGWVAGRDIEERVRYGLLPAEAASGERDARAAAVGRLGAAVGADPAEVPELLERLLDWLGRSASPMVIPWLEDLWLEEEGVNLPGTASSVRPNWQRPMARLLDDITGDAAIAARIERLAGVRSAGSHEGPPPVTGTPS